MWGVSQGSAGSSRGWGLLGVVEEGHMGVECCCVDRGQAGGQRLGILSWLCLAFAG